MTLSVDLDRLLADLHSLAERSRALKLALTTTWTRPMRDEQKELVRVRRHATDLCILRAFVRGRFHLQKPMRDGAYPGMKWDREAFHRAVAERVAKDYAVAPPPPLSLEAPAEAAQEKGASS